MVRYEQHGLGPTWSDEYGSAADATELEWLLSYSPYHHVHDGVDYPAALFTIFDGDTRVDPLHGRKMAAALQHSTTGHPVRFWFGASPTWGTAPERSLAPSSCRSTR